MVRIYLTSTKGFDAIHLLKTCSEANTNEYIVVFNLSK